MAAANKLTERGTAPFTRAELIASVREADPDRQPQSLGPIIQGMTVNTPGGAPPSACGRVFDRVARGEYVLLGSTVPPGRPTPPTRTSPRPRLGRTRRVTPEALESRVSEVVDHFEEYLDAYDEESPFKRRGQFELHRATIDRRRSLGSADAALDDDRFLSLLHRTLNAWGIGIRRSRLAPLPKFRAALERHRESITLLDGRSIEDAQLNQRAVGDLVFALIDQLGVVDNKARLVAGSKTLHHVLPDLVPPMDRAFTGAFFGWSTPSWQDRQRQIFDEAWPVFVRVARTTQPSGFVGSGWRTSTTKLLDNALIGYCIRHDLARG